MNKLSNLPKIPPVSIHPIAHDCPGCRRRQELMQQLGTIADQLRARVQELEIQVGRKKTRLVRSARRRGAAAGAA